MAASGIRLTAAAAATTAAATAAEAEADEAGAGVVAHVHFGIWELQYWDSQWLRIGSLAAESLCACLYNTNILRKLLFT